MFLCALRKISKHTKHCTIFHLKNYLVHMLKVCRLIILSAWSIQDNLNYKIYSICTNAYLILLSFQYHNSLLDRLIQLWSHVWREVLFSSVLNSWLQFFLLVQEYIFQLVFYFVDCQYWFEGKENLLGKQYRLRVCNLRYKNHVSLFLQVF